MSRTTYKELPIPLDDLKVMNGPLFYLENGFISSDGRIFQKLVSGMYTERSVCKEQVRLSGMRKIDDNGVVSEMPLIERIFAKSGRTTITALIGYYWIEKKTLQDIVDNKLVCAKKLIYNEGEPLNYTCLEWMTKKQQDINRGKKNTMNGNGINDKIKQKKELNMFPITNLNMDYFGIINDNHRINKQGNMVIEIIGDKYRTLELYKHKDGYINVHIDKPWRINRLMAEVFIGEIPDGQQVDHIDGNILNNNIDNLEIVSVSENTIRGGTTTTIYKIDPSTKETIQEIRCVREYCEEHYPDNYLLMAKQLSQRIDSGEVFEEYIWSTSKNVSFTIPEIAKIIQKNILSMIYDDETLTDIGITPSETKIGPDYDIYEVIKDIDPRGSGKLNYVNICNNICETTIGNGKCLVCISYHGTADQYQLFICKKTLTVMMISKDNLSNNDGRSLCKVCDFKRVAPNNEHPVWLMPIYLYKHWRNDRHKSYVRTNPLNDLFTHNNPTSVKKALRKTIGNNYPKINNLTLSFKKSNNRDDSIDHHWFIANRMETPMFKHLFT